MSDQQTVQMSCPKCRALTLNVNVSDIIEANGIVTCSHCGHVRTVIKRKQLPNSKHTVKEFVKLSLGYARQMELVRKSNE